MRIPVPVTKSSITITKLSRPIDTSSQPDSDLSSTEDNRDVARHEPEIPLETIEQEINDSSNLKDYCSTNKNDCSKCEAGEVKLVKGDQDEVLNELKKHGHPQSKRHKTGKKKFFSLAENINVLKWHNQLHLERKGIFI